MPIVLIIILLLGLWAFIVWDRRQTIAPLSRKALKQGWVAKPIPKWPVYTGFAAVSAALGIASWLNPSNPPFTGRFSTVFTTVYANFGSHGIAYLWALIAVVLAVFALITWFSSIAAKPMSMPNRD
jgi:hypothetical protein